MKPHGSLLYRSAEAHGVPVIFKPFVYHDWVRLDISSRSMEAFYMQLQQALPAFLYRE